MSDEVEVSWPAGQAQGMVSEDTVYRILRSLRGKQSLTVRYAGEAADGRDAYHVAFDCAMPMEDLAQLAGPPRGSIPLDLVEAPPPPEEGAEDGPGDVGAPTDNTVAEQS